MKKLILLMLLISVSVACTDDDPYSEGMHWDYNIICENGFVYKSMGRDRGTIQVLNSDGTPLKCGQKIK